MEKGNLTDLGKAVFFATKDLKRQKGRTVFMTAVLFALAIISFIFIGELAVYKDDRITRKRDTSAFLQINDRRLSVRRFDKKALTEKDQKFLESVKYVESVDLCDYANDIHYDTSRRMKDSPFMRSDSGITKEDLVKGRLPEKRQEALVSADDASLLGKTIKFYFKCENIWPEGQKCWFKIKIVGVCSQKGKQVYFHPDFCRMLVPSLDGYGYSVDFDQDEMTRKYMETRGFYPIIADDLKGNQARVSKNYNMRKTLDSAGVMQVVNTAFCGKNLPYHITKMQGVTGVGVDEQEDTLEPQVSSRNNGYLEFVPDVSNQGGEFVEVSQELFDKLYSEPSCQASVYITHYIKTDRVIRALNDAGYDAINTYRVSTTEYVMSKVYKRMYIIVFSTGILLVLAVIMILLLSQFLKMQQKELQLLRLMGMRRRPLEMMVYLEMLMLSIPVCVISLLVIMTGGQRIGIGTARRIVQYQNVWSVLGFAGYNLAVVTMAAAMALRRFRSLNGGQNGGIRNDKNKKTR